jgi:hypothetical protein
MSRFEKLLTGLLAILVISVVVLLLLFWSEQRQIENFNREVGAQVAEQASPEQQGTALGAYAAVAPAARAWAADAALIRARGNWPVGTAFQPAEGSWSFLFYSPQRQAVALLEADKDGANVVSESGTDESFDPAGLQQWQVDSPAVVEQLLANGGRDLVQQSGEASLILALNAMEQLVWTATLNATNANRLLRLEIDPATGQVLE